MAAQLGEFPSLISDGNDRERQTNHPKASPRFAIRRCQEEAWHQRIGHFVCTHTARLGRSIHTENIELSVGQRFVSMEFIAQLFAIHQQADGVY